MWNIGLVIGILYGGILTGFFLSLISVRMVGIYQQTGYSEQAFLTWFFRRGNGQGMRLAVLALCQLLLLLLFNLCFSFLGASWANLISLIPYAGLFILYDVSERRYALKVKTVPTARLVRLSVCNTLVWIAICFGLSAGLAAIAWETGKELLILNRFVPFAILPLVTEFVLCLSGCIMKLYEIPRNRCFIRRAGEALAASRCIKVGITGSFGKTTVRSLAEQVLSRKYRVVATPASFNTPAGIARTVKERGTECDIFLAEMGARKRGDIAELCRLVRPSAGVVTGICPQHLESFGSLEAIRAEKGELAAFVQTCVLGASAAELPAKKKLVAGTEFAAEEITPTTEGVSFVLRLGEDRIPVRLPLMGRCAAEDAAMAAALCRELGMNAEEIAVGLNEAAPVPHRLQKLQTGEIVILDDGYNANVEGAKNALETLRLFSGEKYVVTPGLVELGILEEEENEKLGKELVGLNVLLVGETLVLPVRRGYLSAGGEEEKIRLFSTLEKASEFLGTRLKAGDCVLFLNDLPDVMMK